MTFYGKLLDKNIAREIARINLPLSTYTEWYWQIDLHNLFRFLKLRLNPHAQKEIREYAVILLDICKRIVPIAAASFENRILNGVSLSNEEIEAVNNMLDGKAAGLCEKDLCELQKKLRHNIKIDKSGIGMSKIEHGRTLARLPRQLHTIGIRQSATVWQCLSCGELEKE